MPGQVITRPDQLRGISIEEQIGSLIGLAEAATRLDESPEELEKMAAVGRILILGSGRGRQIPESHLVEDEGKWSILPGLEDAIARESRPGRDSFNVALALSWKPLRGPDKDRSQIDRLRAEHARKSTLR